MPPKLLVYLIAKDLTGKSTTEEAFRERLTRFSRSAVIRLCCVLNMLLAKPSALYDTESHAKLVRSFFPTPIADRIINSGQPAFHRHQLLYVAQEALRWCGEAGKDVMTPFWGGFGVVLLMASELLYSTPATAETESEKLARRVCQLLPDMEANGWQSYHLKVLRSFIMTSRFVEPLRNKPNFFDLAALFEHASGIPLETYQALLFGSMARFSKLDEIKKSNNPADFAVPGKWFRSTTVPNEVIQHFFDYVSGSSAALAQLVQEKNPRKNDFTVFRDKPLFCESENFYPLDFALLAEKFETGPFWRLHNQLQAADRPNFHSFWGNVFEGYMNWLMGRSMDQQKTNVFCPDPRYAGKPNEQVCDGIVLCGRCAVLVEYKSSTFTAVSKYGGDPAVLDAELRAKLVGTADSRKGVRQLVEAVNRLCRYDKPEQIKGVNMSNIAVVFPLIITRDDLGAAFGMNAYLNSHFQTLMGKQRFPRSVTPLFCMSVDDVEKLSPYLSDTSLAEALSARYKRDKKLVSSFWAVDNSALDGKGNRKPALLTEGSKALGDMLAARLGLKEE